MAVRSSVFLRLADPHRGTGRRAGIMLRGCTGGPVDAQGSRRVVAQGDRPTRRDHVAGLRRRTGRRAVDMLRGCRGRPVDAHGSCLGVAEEARSTRTDQCVSLQGDAADAHVPSDPQPAAGGNRASPARGLEARPQGRPRQAFDPLVSRNSSRGFLHEIARKDGAIAEASSALTLPSAEVPWAQLRSTALPAYRPLPFPTGAPRSS